MKTKYNKVLKIAVQKHAQLGRPTAGAFGRHLARRYVYKELETMKNYISIILFSILLSLTGCASAISPAREAYIQAKPHGWIELTVKDSSIPSVPVEDKNEDKKKRPQHCNIIMSVNSENYLSERVAATGENAPFTIDTGFRVTVSEGTSKLKINYIGCKVVNNKIINHVSELIVVVTDGFVTPLFSMVRY